MKTAKIIGILVLVIALGIVIIQNREPVRSRFLFITIEMPHILLLLLTAGGGVRPRVAGRFIHRLKKGEQK